MIRTFPPGSVVADYDGRPVVWVRDDVAASRGQAIRAAIDSVEGPWWTDQDFPRLRVRRMRMHAPHPSDTRTWRPARAGDPHPRLYFQVRDPQEAR